MKTEYKGIYRMGKNDLGYIQSKELDELFEVPKHLTSNALHGDTVNFIVEDLKNKIAKVTTILVRSKAGYAGIIKKTSDHVVLDPLDPRDPEIIIPSTDSMLTESEGKKVFVRIDSWSIAGPVGHIDKILGEPGANNTEMMAIALERGFDSDFPKGVVEEAESIAKGKASHLKEYERRDVRSITTFTIDPDDAKDFDDALSVQFLDSGNIEIGVHIADVSYYVVPDSLLDQEAEKRGTSVYLVDRTIPMLPEVLSNDLCSLRQEEDRLAFSAIFEMNETGEILKEWFGRTTIHSNKRFTYSEAQDVLDAGNGLFLKELIKLNTIAKILLERRKQDGALNLETTEVSFVLDDQGVPLDVRIKERKDAHKLIEEFMLLANRRVASMMSEKTGKKGFFVYRVHDRPANDRTEDLRLFFKALGFTPKLRNDVIPSSEIEKILETTKDEYTKRAIQTAVVRSMAKAVYTTENIGHYGLAFKFYTHFTSPIRRYPDILVHRLLQEYISGSPILKTELERYESMSTYASQKERDAQEAEWASIKYKQVEYMTPKIGQTFRGIVSGLHKNGMYVLDEYSRSEGMIRMKDIPNDYFFFDETKRIIRGRKSKKEYRLGDQIAIRLKGTNVEKGFIDFELIVS